MFATTDPQPGHIRVDIDMGSEPSDPAAIDLILEQTNAPTGASTETLDVRELGPPKPLQRTLELIEEMPEEAVLIQYNDRAPQFLFPKLEDRGYAHETIDKDDVVVTAIWRAESDS